MANQGETPHRFEIEFRAALSGIERMEAASQLVDALHRVPGALRPQGAPDVHTDHVAASFDVALAQEAGIAEAAAEGVRLARQALDTAGLGDSRLIELVVRVGSDV
jgi:hypothetical protein